MESAEHRRQLQKIRDYIMDMVNELDKQIADAGHKFTLYELTSRGWVYDSFYGPGNERLYVKNDKLIRVPMDFSYVLTYDAKQMTHIWDLQELEEYAS